jgi:RNA polymerase sigma-70 factor (ECF subfamily)
LVDSKQPDSIRIDREGLLRYARRLARAEAEAQDLVQEVFVRALALSDPESLSNPQGWALTVLGHLYIDRQKGDRRLVREDIAESTAAAVEPDSEPSYADISRSEIDAAISLLPPIFADVVRLFYFERKKQKEISQQLGVPTKTVATRLFRARERLKEILGKRLGE